MRPRARARRRAGVSKPPRPEQSKQTQTNKTSAAKIKHFDPAAFDFGKKKAFPMRPGHFFASCEKAMTELDWAPEYNTVDGLRDSYQNDFVHKKVRGGGGRGGGQGDL